MLRRIIHNCCQIGVSKLNQCPDIISASHKGTDIISYISASSFNTCSRHFFREGQEQRKYASDDNNTDVKKGIEETTTLKNEDENDTISFEEQFNFTKSEIGGQLAKVESGSGFDFSAKPNTRVTIPHRAREYHEYVRQQNDVSVINTVAKLSGIKNINGSIKITVKPALPVNIGRKDIELHEKNPHRSSKFKLTLTPNYNVETNPYCMGKKVFLFTYRNFARSKKGNEIKSRIKGFIPQQFSIISKPGVENDDRIIESNAPGSYNKEIPKENYDETSHCLKDKKEMDVKSEDKDSLFKKYSVKIPSALCAREFLEKEEKQQGSKKYCFEENLIKSSHKQSSRLPLTLSSNESGDGSDKEVKKYGAMRTSRISRKKRGNDSKEYRTKCDELFVKLGLINDKSLKEKVDGDLFMNLQNALQAAESQKLKENCRNTTEKPTDYYKKDDVLKSILSGNEGYDELGQEDRLINKRKCSKRKEDKISDIDSIWGIGRNSRVSESADWKNLPRTKKSKQIRRKKNLKKTKGKHKSLRRTRVTLKAKRKKQTKKRGPEECGDISQNE